MVFVYYIGMEDTFENILSRKNKLEKSIKKLEKRLSRQQEEYNEICTALEVMKRFGVSESDAGNDTADKPATIGDMALEILKDFPMGLTANNILLEIQQRWKPDLVRTSLSPPLSRLKEKEELDYDDTTARWKIASKVPAVETSNYPDWDDEIPF